MNILPAHIRSTGRLIALAIWLLFSLSLATWLYIFSSRQVAQLAEAIPKYAEQLSRHHRMLIWEATSLLICLLVGGIVIAYYIYRDVQQSNRLREFFLSLSHELKTAIASLQLQGEFISSEISDTRQLANIEKLNKDISRLAFQLENSLHLADAGQGQLLLQQINFNECLQSLAIRLPDLKIVSPDIDINVIADRRALDSILLNLGYNSIKHGQATELHFFANKQAAHWNISICDNGRGFSGQTSSLGKFMLRASDTSGSGIGLYLACQLAKRLGGSLSFLTVDSGFSVILKLPANAHLVKESI